MKSLSLLRTCLVGALLWGAGVVSSAQANTISILLNSTAGIELGTVGAGTFVGFLITGPNYNTLAATSATQAVAHYFGAGTETEANETAELNAIAGTTFLASEETKSISGPPLTFTISAEYFSLTLDGPGGGIAFFHNTSGSPLTLTYSQTATQAGLSHYSVWGAPVPGPVVGAGLPGLVMACGGLLALARRRRQKLA
jgi:hypothetical protein